MCGASTSDLGVEGETVRTVHIFQITIGEAKGVPSKKRYYCELLLDGDIAGRTSTKAKLDNECFWSESFNFDSLRSLQSVTVRLYKECLRNNERSVIGDVMIFPHDISGKKPVEKWYSLATAKGKLDDSISIRIKSHFMSLKILPQECYASLLSYVERNPASLCLSLENVLSAKAKEELATTMVRLLYILTREKDFLSSLIEAEILKLSDPKLMFRGNSLGSKAMEAYMKLLGHDYLQYILRDYLQSLIRAGDDCEVDSTKLQNTVNLEKNQHTLNLYTEVIWQRILKSVGEFPGDIRAVFSALKQKLVLSDKGALVDNLISSCVFLRYLCPAVLSPSLFSLVSEYPNETANRTLTLVAKSIQTLANFARFGGKESYMEFMNAFVEKQWTNMKQFLHVISTPLESEAVKARLELDLDKEAARMAQRLFDAVKLLPEGDLPDLREILSAIKALENNPSMLLTPPDVLRSTKRLSDYDNVPTSHHAPHSIPQYSPRSAEFSSPSNNHYDLVGDTVGLLPPSVSSSFVTPPRRSKSAHRRGENNSGSFDDDTPNGGHYPPFPPPPYSSHDVNHSRSGGVPPGVSHGSSSHIPVISHGSNPHNRDFGRLLSAEDGLTPIRRESMQRLRYIDDTSLSSSSCMSTPNSEDQIGRGLNSSNSIESSSPEQTPVPPFTPSASPYTLNSATPTPSVGQSYSNIPSYASSPFRSASYASISSQSIGSLNNYTSNNNIEGTISQGRFFGGGGVVDHSTPVTAPPPSSSAASSAWSQSNNLKHQQHRGSVPSSSNIHNQILEGAVMMTPSGSHPLLARPEPPQYSWPMDPLTDNFYSSTPIPSSPLRRESTASYNGLLVQNTKIASRGIVGPQSNGSPAVSGSRKVSSGSSGGRNSGNSYAGNSGGSTFPYHHSATAANVSGGLGGVAATVMSPLANGHGIPPIPPSNNNTNNNTSRGLVHTPPSNNQLPGGFSAKSPRPSTSNNQGGPPAFPPHDPHFPTPPSSSQHHQQSNNQGQGGSFSQPRYPAHPPPSPNHHSFSAPYSGGGGGGTHHNNLHFNPSTPLVPVAMKPKLSRRLMTRPKSAHLLTGVSSLSSSPGGSSSFAHGGGMGLGSSGGGPGSAASYENVYSPTSPVAWKMIEDRVEKKYTSEMSLLRDKLDQYHTRLERSEKDGEVWKKRYEEIEPKLKEVKDIVTKIQALENEMKESHKKDDIISRQRAQIKSLESINAALLAFSIQFKNGVAVPQNSPGSDPLHDSRGDCRDFSNNNNNNSCISPQNFPPDRRHRSADLKNGKMPLKPTALLNMSPAPALNIPPVPDVVNGLPSSTSPSYSSSGASPASALSSSEGTSPPFPHSMPHSGGQSSLSNHRQPSPLLSSNGHTPPTSINTGHSRLLGQCHLGPGHDLVHRTGSAGTEQDSVASLNCTSSEHSVEDREQDQEDSD